MSTMHRLISDFWGKAHPEAETGSRTHPVMAHCLDVAAVAMRLAGQHEDLPSNAMVGFLVALHDIGKFSRPFQSKSPLHWPSGWLGPFEAANIPAGPPHDAVGFNILSRTMARSLQDLMPAEPGPGMASGWKQSDRDAVWRALTGHHGRPPEAWDQLPRDVFCAACAQAAGQFLAAMRAVFGPQPWWRPKSPRDVILISWRLAGLTTLADWIGSRQAWFNYTTADAVADPETYFHTIAVPRAKAAVEAAGLAPIESAPFLGLRGLFPRIVQPTPIQAWAENVTLPDGPTLTVIEDLTGGGKTEAAMTLVHRLLDAKRGQGVFVALPTMATANAMYGRLASAYKALFDQLGRPSLALAHGHARLDARFRSAIDAEMRQTAGQRFADAADEPAESHCAAWLAQDGRRALLAQVGVGTLDQALLAVLPTRHAPLRLRGLTRKILVVDEVHAFDSYMAREILALLEFHAALGGSAILLSATLPRKSRQRLVNAFLRGLNTRPKPLKQVAYPLVTLVGADALEEIACDVRPDLPRQVTVRRVPDVEAAISRIVAAYRAGAAVAWVRNTVDDAIAATHALRGYGVEAILFHARFAMADRLAIEEEVLRVFGKDSTITSRARVLIATQVVEQSLDIDFDLMVTDLAPVDLLIQRAGRLWRHRRAERPIDGPELVIVSPEPISEPGPDWIKAMLPGTAAVYTDHALLWRTARELFRRGAMVTPYDMRVMIETAFDAEAPDAIPAGLAASSEKTEGAGSAASSIAGSNVLNLEKGYSRDAGDWEPETKTPTRLENEPHVTLRLALKRDGTIVPYASDPDIHRSWALSEVSVAERLIASCPLPVDEERVARAKWGRWERESEKVLLALLLPDGDGYTLHARSKSGASVVTRYDVRDGLSWASE